MKRVRLPSFFLGLLAAFALPGATADTTAAASKVAAHQDADKAGIIVSTLETEQSLDAAIFHERSKIREWVLSRDGEQVDARVLAAEDDGKSEDSQKLAALTRDVRERGKGDGPYHQPIRVKYLSEYRFSEVACDGCEAGEYALRFDSDRRDAQHLTGVLRVDANDRLVRMTYHPYVYPAPANGGDLVASYGTVLDGRRLPVTTSGTYTGRRGLINGTLKLDQHVTYRRYASLDEATAAAEHL